MNELRHTTPCRECPWRRDAAQGWLGSDTAPGFLAKVQSEVPLPCHLHVNYEADDWKAQADDAPLCAGALAYMANTAKLPRDRHLADAVRTVGRNPNVFTSPASFADHHIGYSPYAQTVKDALFMWENGERHPDVISKRLRTRRDTVEAAFRRTGHTIPWIEQ